MKNQMIYLQRNDQPLNRAIQNWPNWLKELIVYIANKNSNAKK